jgi:hypothetical protein
MVRPRILDFCFLYSPNIAYGYSGALLLSYISENYWTSVNIHLQIKQTFYVLLIQLVI